MNKYSLVFGAAMAAFSFSNGFAAPAEEFVTAAQIAAARTPADHEAIATTYEAEAAGYDKKVELHKAMQRTYQYVNRSLAVARHCDRLVTDFENTAQQYRAMAAAHRAMAKKAE